jgi:hypothetical protein
MQNETKHTPGPWKINGTGILNHPVTGAAVSLIRIETTLGNIEIHDETNEPDYNARLIAAAPELLEALEECTTERGAMAYRNHELALKRIEYINGIVRASIAKAKGN